MAGSEPARGRLHHTAGKACLPLPAADRADQAPVCEGNGKDFTQGKREPSVDFRKQTEKLIYSLLTTCCSIV